MYRDFLKPCEAGYFLCAPVLDTPHNTFGLAIHRPMNREDFGSTDKRFIKMLIPHLYRAYQIHSSYHEITREREFFRETLHISSYAILLFNKNGRVCFINRTAERFLNNNSYLKYKNGKLVFRSLAKQAEFDHILHQANLLNRASTSGSGGKMLIPASDGSEPLLLTIASLSPKRRHHLMDTGAVACVLIRPPDKHHLLPIGLLQNFYQLTPAESRLTECFYSGSNIEKISKSLGIRITTARTHLYHVMEKTGVHSQTELMKLLAHYSCTSDL